MAKKKPAAEIEPVSGVPVARPEDILHQYRKERYAAHISCNNRLDDLAFKTSERYDQWILTLSGGALALSVTFLEKIAPEPTQWTLISLLGPSWLAYIGAILSGFYAISLSREAIYEQMAIDAEEHRIFMATSTPANMMGNASIPRENRHLKRLSYANRASSACLVMGTILLCLFAWVNVRNPKSSKKDVAVKPLAVDVNLPQFILNAVSNATHGTNMSKEANESNENKSTTPTNQPDGSLRGVKTGDLDSIEGSYKPPTSQAPPPAPPTPKKD